MAKTSHCALAVLVALLWTQTARTKDQASQPLTPAQQERLKERDRYNTEIQKLRAADKVAEAIPICQKMLAIDRDLFGNVHEDVAGALGQLASMCQQQGDFTVARLARQEVIGITTKLHGPNGWQTADAHRALEDLQRWIGWDPESRKQSLEADQLNDQAERLRQQGRFREALPLAQHAFDLRKMHLTENHSVYATSLANLAELYRETGDFAQALPLCLQARDLRKKLLTENHPDYAASLNNLALLQKVMGNFGQALPLYLQARDLYKKLLTENHPDYATCLHNLAMLYMAMGDYAQALPLCLQARDLRRRLLTENHPAYANCINNLALLYWCMGEDALALPLCLQARDLRRKLQTENHPNYATSLNNLALLYQNMGDYAKALPLFLQARDLRKMHLTENHPDYATSLVNLALLYQNMGDYAQAMPLFLQARDLRKRLLTENHPAYAASLNSLALLHQSTGDYAMGLSLCDQAVTISSRTLELAAAVQSERQQFAMAWALRFYLDNYLTLGPPALTAVERSYGPVLVSKGAVFARQRLQRLQRQRPELASEFAQLNRVTVRLATLALGTPAPAQQVTFHRQLSELSEQKEKAERALMSRSAEYRQSQEKLAPAGLQALLPPDTVLVDFLEYRSPPPPTPGKKPPPWQSKLLAFVVRSDGIHRVELGPAGPVAAAVEQWQAQMTGKGITQTDPAQELRRLVWQPLEPHLHGVRTGLVSPDGALSRLPWAALPGSQPGRYLIEDLAIAVLPVPQMLAELLAAPGRAEQKASRPPASLLLVGDVDYGAASGALLAGSGSRSAARNTRQGVFQEWKRLPETRTEIASLRDLFEQRHPGVSVTQLRGSQATEGAVRQQAEQHRYLHLATHGFFAPPEVRSALSSDPKATGDPFGSQGIAGWHPGLLSGLVLAGANRPHGENEDDGILTALEVASLDLHNVDLAVLSACETGLGEVAGGEGLLGLQRAFQVAGAKSVVASLWAADDIATRDLMIKFYEHLWSPEKALSKVEALRQAQLWMLSEGKVRGAGGQRPVDAKDLAGAKPGSNRTPPYYWAGFILSGDWR